MTAVTFNGDRRDVAEGTTVARLVDDLGSGRRGVAVAINSEVIPRRAWDTTILAPEDRVEVLRAIQGGC